MYLISSFKDPHAKLLTVVNTGERQGSERTMLHASNLVTQTLLCSYFISGWALPWAEDDRLLWEQFKKMVQSFNQTREKPSGDLEGFTQNCMKCICHVEGCESQVGRCKEDMGSLSCGPYQIKLPYWTDCYRPGPSWKGCTKYMACSETCVRSYMSRYGERCTRGRTPTCKDYAMIHNGGPLGCRRGLIGYWNKVKACCDVTGGC